MRTLNLIFLVLIFWGSLLEASTNNDLTAILSLQKGAQVSQADLFKILKHPSVKKSKSVFGKTEKKILKNIQADYLGQSWILTLKDEKSFDLIEKQLRRLALPMNLDWNDLQVATQSDSFESLQWGLNNLGISQAIDLDPVMTFKIPGVSHQDINLAPPALLASKKVLVAVLDTGISHFHPDLFRNIHRNESECAALEKFKKCLSDLGDRKVCEEKWMDPKNPEVDEDKNGYPLDCSGWSTIGGINAAQIMGKPDFDDEQGHGSHVAGIIAAQGNNQEGIRGVSANVEILPIQVIGSGPSEPLKPLSADLNPKEDVRHGRAQNGLSDLVARGVIYAISSGAKVMSFSIGWPQGTDSSFMRSLIEEAQSRGIIIVAAAGNDSTRALLRPCAYPGVICVAAHGPDGGLAHFSNYGSGVDVAAPGIDILSTYPMDKRPVRFRQTLGYEYLSGTSQATPFVTGVVADMLSRGIPSQDIYARIVLGSRPLLANQSLIEGASHTPGRVMPAEKKPYEKYLLGGQLDMQKSLSVSPQPLIIPWAKEKTAISWDRKQSQLSWVIALQNRWQSIDVNQIQLKAQFSKKSSESIRPEVISILPVQSNKAALWAQGEVRQFEVKFQITDTSDVFNSRIPSDLELQLEISSPQMPLRKYILEGEIIVSVTANLNDPDVYQIPLTNMPQARFDLVPIDENLDGDLQKRDYMLVSQIGQAAKYQLWLLTQKTGSSNLSGYATVAGPKITVDGDVKNIRTQIQSRLDQNGKGQTQFVLGFYEDLSDDQKPSPMSFYFFTPEMKLADSFKYDSVLAQIPFAFLWQQVGSVKMPAWVGYGKDPAKVRNLRDRWENPSNKEKNQMRFYYLDQNKKLKALQKYNDYIIVDTIQPTPEQMRQGRVPILLAKNKGTDAKPSYLYDFATAEVLNGEIQNFMSLDFFAQAGTYRNILDTRVDKVNSLDPNGGEYNGSFWFGEGELRTQRLSFFNSESLVFNDQMLRAERSQFDSALWVRAVFDGKNRKGAFVLTNSEIQYHDLVSGEVSSTSFERYTFFPDFYQTNAYFPITLRDTKNPSAKLPALFTTEESELNRGVKMLVPVFASSGRLVEMVSPARLRFATGKGCRPLNTPVFMGDQGSAFDYYCGDRILRIPLNY